jgi:hypothetical protein
MAALLGYEAYGLEIDTELVRLSRAIARRLRIPVEILCTSLFPEGYEAYAGVDGVALVTPAASRSAPNANDAGRRPLRYEGMAIDIAAIGVFFAYPWPEEQELMQQLFDAVAREGAILVVYHTDTDIRVFRKLKDNTAWHNTPTVRESVARRS